MSDASSTPSQATDAKPAEAPPKLAAPTSWQRFWRRYSPYGEFPRSSISSLMLHLALVLLLILMSGALKPPEHTPPGVDVVQVGDDADVAPGMGDGLPAAGLGLADAPVAAGADRSSDSTPGAMPSQAVPIEAVPIEAVGSPLAPTTLIGDSLTPSTDQRAVDAAQASAAASRAVQQARRSLDRAKQRLAKNLDQPGGGGQGLIGDSKGSGDGTGGGGGQGAAGRSARTGRWILRFEHASYEDLLAQYEGLGAELAFPLSNDKFRFFTKLTAPTPRSQTRSLDSESRLYWIEEVRSTVAGIAGVLNMTPTAYMLAFLPAALEEKMLKLELSYANLREDQIAKTEFKVVRRGGGFDVIVFSQTPR